MGLYDRLAQVRQGRAKRPQEVQKGPRLTRSLGGQEIKTPWGTYYLIEKEWEGQLAWPIQGRDCLDGNLRLVKGIGPVTASKLWDWGYKNLEDLCGHPRWQEEARHCLELIANQDFAKLRRRGAGDGEILQFFQPEDLVFLDIESTGLWFSQPLFLVGLLFWREGKYILKQFLARHYGEEKALLAGLFEEMEPFQVVVTYNGRKFDIPYIEGRSVAHGLYYQFHQEQVDLLFHARRCYRDHLPNCRLVTLEEWVLNTRREGDIPGHLIPEVYHRFVQTQEPSLMGNILTHNGQDLMSLARLLPLVGEEGLEGDEAGGERLKA